MIPLNAKQGKVHNPTGEGVRVVSAQAQAKFLKHQAHQQDITDHETKVKEEGSAKRNITRKKTDPRETGNFDSRNKKQGGHGKGKWKDDDMLYDDEPVPLDENDPCYDEQQGPGIILSSVEDPESRNYLETEGKPVYGPMLTQSEFKLQVQDCLKEYFESCDSDEFIRSIEELQCREFHSDVVKRAVSLSLDKHPRERELVSRLLTCLHPAPLSDEDMEAGFDTLLDSLDDLTTDVPEAPVRAPFSQLLVAFQTSHSHCSVLSCSDRLWLPILWPVRSSMKSYHLLTCRIKTTNDRETPSSRRPFLSCPENIAQLAWSVSGDPAMAVL